MPYKGLEARVDELERLVRNIAACRATAVADYDNAIKTAADKAISEYSTACRIADFLESLGSGGRTLVMSVAEAAQAIRAGEYRNERT